MAKAESSRLDVVSTSRRTKARAARVYNERRVALVDVVGEEWVGTDADGEDSLRGNWDVFDGCFVSVLVAVGIEVGVADQGKPGVGFHVQHARGFLNSRTNFYATNTMILQLLPVSPKSFQYVCDDLLRYRGRHGAKASRKRFLCCNTFSICRRSHPRPPYFALTRSHRPPGFYTPLPPVNLTDLFSKRSVNLRRTFAHLPAEFSDGHF